MTGLHSGVVTTVRNLAGRREMVGEDLHSGVEKIVRNSMGQGAKAGLAQNAARDLQLGKSVRMRGRRVRGIGVAPASQLVNLQARVAENQGAGSY